MATISKGILGGFSGLVGTVVGGRWNGIDYIRSRPTISDAPPTPAQQQHRARFSLVAKFLTTMKDLLKITFQDFANKMTGPNSALAYTMKNGVAGSYPDFELDYGMILVARGSLINANNPVAVAGPVGKITFNWGDNSGIASALASDKAILVAYCESLQQSVFTTAGALRSAGTATLDVPGFSGRMVQTWVSFVSDKGKDIATSVFSGTVNVL